MSKTELTTGSLAVKYRPKRFKDLCGQEKIVTKLMGVLRSKKIPSVFLISGSTGVGKTTLAKMIARYMNCDTMDACGKCDNCKMFNKGTHPDFEELNMSNTRGIDDMRSIIRKAQNRPMIGSLRCILLDECHQMTPQAWQSALLPLESPPEQTLWILSTTDPEKLPKAVLGRCYSLPLNRIDKDVVVGRLKYVARKEGIRVKEKVFGRIAELTGGHMRNAIQLLENCQSMLNSGKKIKTKQLLAMLASDAADSNDATVDEIAMRVLIAIYGGSLVSLWKFLAPLTSEWVGFTNRLIWFNQYYIESEIVGKGPMVWHTASNTKFRAMVKKTLPEFQAKASIQKLSALHIALVKLRNEIVTVSGPERGLIAGRLAETLIDKH